MKTKRIKQSNKTTWKKAKNGKKKVDNGIDIGTLVELATSNRKYVNVINLHEIKSKILQNKVDFRVKGIDGHRTRWP